MTTDQRGQSSARPVTEARTLALICIDASCPPLFDRASSGARDGYEPDVAKLVAARLGLAVAWVYRPWAQMIPALLDGDGDAILCGQAITEARSRIMRFTRPYAVFDESVIVRTGGGIRAAQQLEGRRVGAIAASSNMALAETFPGAITVAFDGSSADVFGEMIAALRHGQIDAVVDDDVALLPLAAEPDLEIAFSVPTRNSWAVAVAVGRDDLRHALDRGITSAIDDGSIERAWQHWMPELPFPFHRAQCP